MPNVPFEAKTASDALLVRLKQLGVDYFFGNAGTDFAPIVESLANGALHGADMPEALPVLHETVAVGMAHGYYFATGKPQAVMVHVNVGLANAAMGVIMLRAARSLCWSWLDGPP